MTKLSQKSTQRRQTRVKPYRRVDSVSTDVYVIDDNVEVVRLYPATSEERIKYVSTKTNKQVTPFQFRVYDLCAQRAFEFIISQLAGCVSTYKIMSDALNASPRAVGQALRNNPFAPLPIPCHRVVASNFFIGGFDGQWGSGNNICNKKAKLVKEGLEFDEDDKLAVMFRETRVFSDFKV
ncbi:hypothetical protein BC936DRAFT_140833 [Jimgerdemannia flammicorona]|uniref:Methylated-DNA--protein-cysteine methyltransferase n=1 Tax=Jimgerdemannia flammicorona TaxID=994334 RepID=A0A433A3D1_9FUNG|nr:hypothetical protein BC936DRAFT_140833 [Jimgerdemannia flammicorona]